MSTFRNIIQAITGTDEQPPRTCKKCGTEIPYSDYIANHCICPECGTYFRMRAVERLDATVDPGSFQEIDKKLRSKDPIKFPDYSQKLDKAEKASGLNEGVVCGTAKISGMDCGIFVMDSAFMMGSMGTVVGEKITRIIEKSTELRLPVIGFITSGGARMQEGIFSLMQMAKVSGAVKRHSEAGLLYIAVLTDPTTRGARRPDRLYRTESHPADHRRHSSGGLPEGGIPAGARLCRSHRGASAHDLYACEAAEAASGEVNRNRKTSE